MIHVPIPRGTVFGRLTVLRRCRPTGGGARYTARCSCGKRTTVIATNLRYGVTKSCGCLRADMCRALPRMGEQPDVVCFRAVVLEQVPSRLPLWPHEIAKRVREDYGSFVDRRFWRALAALRTSGKIARVEGGYVKARSA